MSLLGSGCRFIVMKLYRGFVILYLEIRERASCRGRFFPHFSWIRYARASQSLLLSHRARLLHKLTSAFVMEANLLLVIT